MKILENGILRPMTEEEIKEFNRELEESEKEGVADGDS